MLLTRHAGGYAAYTFTGRSPEDPPVAHGTTVLQDSIEFADRYVHLAAR